MFKRKHGVCCAIFTHYRRLEDESIEWPSFFGGLTPFSTGLMHFFAVDRCDN